VKHFQNKHELSGQQASGILTKISCFAKNKISVPKKEELKNWAVAWRSSLKKYGKHFGRIQLIRKVHKFGEDTKTEQGNFFGGEG